MEETPSANNSEKVNDGPDGENEARDWKDVKKKQRKINYGKAKVTTGRSDVAVAPYEVFIANTHPESTAELIKEILIECASDDTSRDSPLEVIDVKCMMNREKIPNPRTLCWKVTVPNREREYMMKDESYPEGWGHRRFFPPKSSVPLLRPTQPAAKQPHVEVTTA